ISPHDVSLFYQSATTHPYPLSLHDALPISNSRFQSRISRIFLSTSSSSRRCFISAQRHTATPSSPAHSLGTTSFRKYSRSITGSDRKSTRLNSSHVSISYAVFCLKKKKDTT